MAPKRAGGRGAGRPAKKAKTEVAKDPMKEAVKALVGAFEDDDQVGLSTVPAITKEMLGSVIPTSLGAGAAADERHEYQVKIADAIGEVLKEVVTIWEGKIVETKDGVTAAEALRTEKAKISETAEATLATKTAETTAAQEKLSAAKTALDAAGTTLKSAKLAVDAFAVELTEKEGELASLKGVLTGNFEPLKAGLTLENAKEKKAAEQTHLESIKSTLKTLKADTSLMSALESALTKKPENRGQFDSMAIEQLESILTTKIAKDEEVINNQESLKAEKAAAVTDGETNLANCKEAKTQGEADLDAAKKAEKEASSSLKDAKKAVVSQDKAVEAAKETASDAETSLGDAKKHVESFEFLYSRPSKAPEPEPVEEAPAEEAPVEAPAEAEPMAVEPTA